MNIDDLNGIRRHDPTLDTARGAAVIGVFLIHASASYVHDTPTWAVVNAMMRWSIPLLFMISGALWRQSTSRLSSGTAHYLWMRARRLAPAYLFWTIVYLPLSLKVSGLVDVPSLLRYASMELVLNLLTGRGAYHLWFFPTLWLVTALSSLWVRRHRMETGVIIAGIGLLAAAVVSGLANASGTAPSIAGVSVPEMLYSSPLYWTLAFLLGALYSQGQSSEKPMVSATTAMASGALLLLLDAFLLFKGVAGWRSLIEPAGGYLLAVGIWHALMHVRPASAPLAWLGRGSLGFYGVHAGALLAAQRLSTHLHYGPIPVALLAFTVSIAYVLVAKRVRPLRFTAR